MSEPQYLHTIDRTLQVECVLDENAFQLAISPVSGEHHFLKFTFTKGFAQELRDWLDGHLKSDGD